MIPLHSVVHVTAYQGATRDDWGEVMQPKTGKDGSPQVLVRLFASENRLHEWRCFRAEDVEVEK